MISYEKAKAKVIEMLNMGVSNLDPKLVIFESYTIETKICWFFFMEVLRLSLQVMLH